LGAVESLRVGFLNYYELSTIHSCFRRYPGDPGAFYVSNAVVLVELSYVISYKIKINIKY
jgi:hypothetical protein